MPECNPPEHFCGGICVGNTAQTGCYGSSSCTPCTAVQNGTTTCTAAGVCDFTCALPYQKNGNQCVCPTACCVAADCGGDACVGGVCQTPCDDMLCEIACIASGYVMGICTDQYTCSCL